MHSFAKASVVLYALADLGCASPDPDTKSSPSPASIVEMVWGNLDSPDDTGGFGMKVTLLADGHLSCRYSFSGDFMGFAGDTTSTGSVTPQTIRYLERVFTDAQYLALPSEMPSGTLDPIRAEYQLSTSFGGSTKLIRLVPGQITVEAENNRLMESVDTVFNVCPTRPLTPIKD